MYEESVRIPLSFKFPSHENITPRTVLDEVSNIDVLPTLCDYLGLAARQSFDGRSLLSAIRGGTPDSRAVFIQYDGNGSYSNFQRCVVKDRYKLIVDCFGAENYYELYNVGSDPQEMNNLIFTAAEDDRVEELFSLLNEHMKRTGDELSLQPLNLEQFRANYASIPAK
jgi:arylsulfatase A-like enzyme